MSGDFFEPHMDKYDDLCAQRKAYAESLPQSEAEMILNQICGITPDGQIKSLQEKFNLDLLNELLFENFGITDNRKATMKQLGRCLQQIKELDQVIADGKAKKL